MSGGVPDEEALRRIELGVQHRIGRRRRVAQRVGGTAAALGALAIVVGGFSLVLPQGASLSSGSSAGGSSGGGSASDSGARGAVKVACHEGAAADADGKALAAEADPNDLPWSALEACARVLADGASVASAPEATPESSVQGLSAGSASPSVSPSALPGVVCRADDGLLNVYVDGTACGSVGMTRVDG